MDYLSTHGLSYNGLQGFTWLLIPDEPKMLNYVTAARSNSILDQRLGLKEFTKVIIEHLSSFETTPSIQVSIGLS